MMKWEKEGDEYVFDGSFSNSFDNPTREELVTLWLEIQRHDLFGWRQKFINAVAMFFIKMLPISNKQVILDNTQKYCDELASGGAGAEKATNEEL